MYWVTTLKIDPVKYTSVASTLHLDWIFPSSVRKCARQNICVCWLETSWSMPVSTVDIYNWCNFAAMWGIWLKLHQHKTHISQASGQTSCSYTIPDLSINVHIYMLKVIQMYDYDNEIDDHHDNNINENHIENHFKRLDYSTPWDTVKTLQLGRLLTPKVLHTPTFGHLLKFSSRTTCQYASVWFTIGHFDTYLVYSFHLATSCPNSSVYSILS